LPQLGKGAKPVEPTFKTGVSRVAGPNIPALPLNSIRCHHGAPTQMLDQAIQE